MTEVKDKISDLTSYCTFLVIDAMETDTIICKHLVFKKNLLIIVRHISC